MQQPWCVCARACVWAFMCVCVQARMQRYAHKHGGYTQYTSNTHDYTHVYICKSCLNITLCLFWEPTLEVCRKGCIELADNALILAIE